METGKWHQTKNWPAFFPDTNPKHLKHFRETNRDYEDMALFYTRICRKSPRRHVKTCQNIVDNDGY